MHDDAGPADSNHAETDEIIVDRIRSGRGRHQVQAVECGIGDDALPVVLAAADEEAVDGPAGEEAALERWQAFVDDDLAEYGTARE